MLKKFLLSVLLVCFISVLSAEGNGKMVCVSPWFGELPVHLVERNVNVESINGIVAVEIEDYYFNHSETIGEGIYSFELPPDGFVTGLWINTDGKEWVEGEIKRINEARLAYRTITNRIVDPGILEQKGNEVSLRVFPVENNSKVGIRFNFIFLANSIGNKIKLNLPTGFDQTQTQISSLMQRSGLQKAKFSLKAQIYENDLMSDISFNDDSFKVEKDDQKVRLSLNKKTASMDNILVSYNTKNDAKLTKVFNKASDGSKISLLRLRNIIMPELKSTQLAVIVDTSGSMGHRNKKRALNAVNILNSFDKINISLFATVADRFEEISFAQLKSREFYGQGNWAGLNKFPTNNDFDGVVLITDGLRLQSNHLKDLSRKIRQRAVHLIYLAADKNDFFEAVARQYGGSTLYQHETTNQELKESLKRALLLTSNNPQLYLPDNSMLIPLAGTPDKVAYYLTAFQSGKHSLLTSEQEVLFEFKIASFDKHQKHQLDLIDTLVARSKIRQLEVKPQTPEVVEQIVKLGLKYKQVTDYTAFLAVPDDIAREHADALNPAYLSLFAPTPNFRRSRAQARNKACYANQRVIFGAIEMYLMDHSDIEVFKHDFYTGKFDINAIREYLRGIPRGPEEYCDYRLIGDFYNNYHIVCVVHGALGIPAEEVIREYCIDNDLDFNDFDFPFELHRYAHHQNLSNLLRRYESLFLLLSYML